MTLAHIGKIHSPHLSELATVHTEKSIPSHIASFGHKSMHLSYPLKKIAMKKHIYNSFFKCHVKIKINQGKDLQVYLPSFWTLATEESLSAHLSRRGRWQGSSFPCSSIDFGARWKFSCSSPATQKKGWGDIPWAHDEWCEHLFPDRMRSK